MHSGKIGGGRLGIGKTPFLVWSKAKLVDVADEDENFQTGIAVGKLDDPDLPERIWRFVRNLHSFKEEAVSGRLKTTEFNRMVEEYRPSGILRQEEGRSRRNVRISDISWRHCAEAL